MSDVEEIDSLPGFYSPPTKTATAETTTNSVTDEVEAIADANPGEAQTEQKQAESEVQDTDTTDLEAAAAEVEFSPEQITALKAAGILESAVMDRAKARGLLPGEEKPVKEEATKEVVEEEPAAALIEFPDLSDDDLAEMPESLVNVINATKSQFEALAKQNKALQDRLNKQDAQLQETAVRETVRRVDNELLALKEYSDAVGVGFTEQLDPTTDEFKNRVAFYEKYEMLQTAYASNGKNIPAAQIVREAAKLAFAEEANTSALQRLALKQKGITKGTPPVARRTTSLTDSQRHADVIAQAKSMIADGQRGKPEKLALLAP